MEETVNLICLKKAIQEHAPRNKVSCENNTILFLNNHRIDFRGNLLQSERTSFRFNAVRELIIELFHEGFLYCSDEDLIRIKARYDKLTGQDAASHFKHLFNKEKA